MADTSGFVKIKSEVHDSERIKTYGASTDTRPRFNPGDGIITLIGLPGSGRRKLADLLAGSLNMEVCAPEPDIAALLKVFPPLGAAGASAHSDAVGRGSGRGKILVLGSEHLVLQLTNEGQNVDKEESGYENVAALLKFKSKVFWLMAEPLKLARVNGIPPAAAEAWIRQAVSSEELFYGALHFILQADEDGDVLMQNVMDSILY